MSKRITMFILGVSLLSAATVCFAEEVYVTTNGKKYHKEDCRFIKNRETQKMEKQDATEQGLVPCQKCFKEDLSEKNETPHQHEKQSFKFEASESLLSASS